jgi:hypothetical protein
MLSYKFWFIFLGIWMVSVRDSKEARLHMGVLIIFSKQSVSHKKGTTWKW